MKRYVALGSSMAAGPGIPPRAPGSPRAAMRSARNYPHLLADDLGLDLVDVTYSGATTAHVLTDRQNGTAPQVTALDGTEDLVTITIGGNDIAYVPGMYVATLPRRAAAAARCVGGRLRDVLDPGGASSPLDEVAGSLVAVGERVRERSPHARVLFVEYQTLLPPAGQKSPPLRREHADLARHLADRLAELTAKAAAATGCRGGPGGRGQPGPPRVVRGPVDGRRHAPAARPAAGLPPERRRHARGGGP